MIRNLKLIAMIVIMAPLVALILGLIGLIIPVAAVLVLLLIATGSITIRKPIYVRRRTGTHPV